MQLFDAKYSILVRVSTGVVRIAHLSIFRKNISARTNVGAPPCSYIRAGPRHPKIVLPYSKHVTASACTSYTRTRLLINPSNLA